MRGGVAIAPWPPPAYATDEMCFAGLDGGALFPVVRRVVVRRGVIVSADFRFQRFLFRHYIELPDERSTVRR